MGDISIKTATALSGDEREAWSALQEGDPLLASPYFSLGYLDAMASARDDVRVIVKRQNGAPVAFLPLQRGLLGHARPLGGPLGDHHGAIGDVGGGNGLTQMLRKAGIGVFDFHGALAAQRAFADHARSQDGSWVIDLSKGYDAFIEERSAVEPKAFRNLRARRRKLDEAGARLRVHDDRPGVLETALSWKSEQYVTTGHFDVFSVDWTRTLISNLMRTQGSDCRGLVSSLEIGGELAAVHVGMRSDRVLHYWFPVYDPRFSKFGPGLALLLELCRALSTDGVEEVHLGPGAYEFKAQLAAWQIPLAQGYAGSGAVATVRRLAEAVETGSERLPLGRFSTWPGKAFRRIDRMAGFRPA